MATRTIFGPPAAERVPKFAISHVSPNSRASAQGFDAGQVLVDVAHTAADQMSFALLATRLGRRPCRVVAVDPDAWGESSDEQSASEEEGEGGEEGGEEETLDEDASEVPSKTPNVPE